VPLQKKSPKKSSTQKKGVAPPKKEYHLQKKWSSTSKKGVPSLQRSPKKECLPSLQKKRSANFKKE
jgi:hypothetical protein